MQAHFSLLFANTHKINYSVLETMEEGCVCSGSFHLKAGVPAPLFVRLCLGKKSNLAQNLTKM